MRAAARPSSGHEVPVRERGEDAALAEADDVGRVVAVDVAEQARVVVLRVPTARAGREGSDVAGRGLEGAVAFSERDLNARLAEADDVSKAVRVHVRDMAG